MTVREAQLSVRGELVEPWTHATLALYGRAGPVTFGIAPKVTKNASPCTPLHPTVLATGRMFDLFAMRTAIALMRASTLYRS